MILHVDMDAFFASVEEATNPALRGLPIVVAGAAKRSVITTASYEARKYGVKTGMTVIEGLRLCPSLKIVVANFKKYESTSVEIMNILKQYGPLEVYSIDEAFIDIGDRDPEKVTMQFKQEIWNMFNLTCSVGAAKNKTLAKLASGLKKPNGFFCIHDLSQISHLPISEICGIGKKTYRKLVLEGILTIEDLLKAPIHIIKNIMGINGIRIVYVLKGELKEHVNTYEEGSKSIGHSMTFEKDLFHKEEIDRALFQLAEKVAYRLRKKQLLGRHVSVIVRYNDFYTFSLEHRQYAPISEEKEIFNISKNMVYKAKLTKPVRLFGISVSDLLPNRQCKLFEDLRGSKTLETIDKIREKWGFNAITWGCVKDKYRHNPPISPAWRPDKAC